MQERQIVRAAEAQSSAATAPHRALPGPGDPGLSRPSRALLFCLLPPRPHTHRTHPTPQLLQLRQLSARTGHARDRPGPPPAGAVGSAGKGAAKPCWSRRASRGEWGKCCLLCVIIITAASTGVHWGGLAWMGAPRQQPGCLWGCPGNAGCQRLQSCVATYEVEEGRPNTNAGGGLTTTCWERNNNDNVVGKQRSGKRGPGPGPRPVKRAMSTRRFEQAQAAVTVVHCHRGGLT